VACLVGPGGIDPLIPCEQILSTDGRFLYQGGRLPIAPDLAARVIAIAVRAAACVPGLLGYVGVDVILGSDGRDWAIEINPRLTTSYVGLRRLSEVNLLEAILAVVRGKSAALRWRAGSVEFDPTGAVEFRSPPPNQRGV
jgi:predicted ATP-grasp superfamily ATP-dependent carboligase